MKITRKKSSPQSKNPPRIVFVNLAGEYGPPMTFSHLASALAGQSTNPSVRAVLQILRLQLGMAREHERDPNQPRDYASGAAAAADTTMEMIYHLINRNFEHGLLAELRANFPDPKSNPETPSLPQKV